MELTAYEVHMIALAWRHFMENPPKDFEDPSQNTITERQDLANKLDDFNVQVCFPFHNLDAVVLVQAPNPEKEKSK